MCTKCGVRHGAPTGKKCAQLGEGEKLIPKPQEGAVTNGLQVPISVESKAVVADHLTPPVDERIDEVEKSVTQMKNMMTLRAVGVKDTEQDLTDSPVEMSTGNGFFQVRSRKKKSSKRSQRKYHHFRARSTSDSSVTSASDEDEGKTKEFARKRFLANDVKAKSVEDILLIGIKMIHKAVTEKSDPLPVIRHVKFLAEKATKKMFAFESVAFVKYDKAVVNEKGIGQFGIIETDEVYSHFSLENTVKVTGRARVSQKVGVARLVRAM